ncbi:hypothetical protein AAVH_10859 [Aphelenchoides avenae]|nr:hypothetical protein AAVH_10859 [Aphelenchus avenae]
MQQFQSQLMFYNTPSSVQLRSIDAAPGTSNGSRPQIPQFRPQLTHPNVSSNAQRERANGGVRSVDGRMEDLLRRAAEEAKASLEREQRLEATNKLLREKLQKVKQQLENESGARLQAEQQLATANARISTQAKLEKGKSGKNALETQLVQRDERADMSRQLEHSSTEPPSEQPSLEELENDDIDALMKVINSIKTEVFDEVFEQIVPAPEKRDVPPVDADTPKALKSPPKSDSPHHRTPMLCNGYKMYRSFRNDGLQIWKCRWVHLGCRGRAECAVGSTQLTESAAHNHAADMKPKGTAVNATSSEKLATRSSMRLRGATKAEDSAQGGRRLRSSMRLEALQKKTNYALKSNVVGSKPPVKRSPKTARVGVNSAKKTDNKQAKLVPNVLLIGGHEMLKYRLHIHNGRVSTGWHCRWRFEDPACPAFVAADVDTLELDEVEPHNHPVGEKPRHPVDLQSVNHA